MAGSDFAMGHSGQLLIDGSEVCFSSITVTENGTDVDVSQSGANGQYRLTANGLKQLEITFTLNYDAANNPYSDPPDLEFGNTVAVYYYPDRADNTQFWYAAVMKVAGGTSLNNTLDSAQPITFKLLSDGVYANPVG